SHEPTSSPPWRQPARQQAHPRRRTLRALRVLAPTDRAAAPCARCALRTSRGAASRSPTAGGQSTPRRSQHRLALAQARPPASAAVASRSQDRRAENHRRASATMESQSTTLVTPIDQTSTHKGAINLPFAGARYIAVLASRCRTEDNPVVRC